MADLAPQAAKLAPAQKSLPRASMNQSEISFDVRFARVGAFSLFTLFAIYYARHSNRAIHLERHTMGKAGAVVPVLLEIESDGKSIRIRVLGYLNSKDGPSNGN